MKKWSNSKRRRDLVSKLYFYYKKPFQFSALKSINVVIDGQKTIKVKDKEECCQFVEAGSHTIQISSTFLFWEIGTTTLQVRVGDKESYKLTYKAPIFIYLPGTILVDKKSNIYLNFKKAR